MFVIHAVIFVLLLLVAAFVGAIAPRLVDTPRLLGMAFRYFCIGYITFLVAAALHAWAFGLASGSWLPWVASTLVGVAVAFGSIGVIQRWLARPI